MSKCVLVIAAVLLVPTSCPAQVQKAEGRITCTGTLIDVWLTPKGRWPLAVIYDDAGRYTCSINRDGSGHDPLKPCAAGERCRITGSYREFGNKKLNSVTYSIQMIDSIDRVGEQQ
jgi:hypothetical protein